MRKPQLSSRRGKALQRVLIAAAALFLANRFLLVGLLLPMQALRYCEEREGTGRTSVICRDWPQEAGWNQLVYLTENENATMLAGVKLNLFGWSGGLVSTLDCSVSAPLQGGWMSLPQEGSKRLFYVFGRVDDPAVARVEILLQYKEWESAGGVRHTAFSWASGQEEWMEQDGRRYFLIRKYPVEWRHRSDIFAVAVGYDESGNEAVRIELDPHFAGGTAFEE